MAHGHRSNTLGEETKGLSANEIRFNRLEKMHRSMWWVVFVMFILTVYGLAHAHPQTLYQGQVFHSDKTGKLGIIINYRGIITRVRYHSPAFYAGLQINDKIVKVDYQDFSLGRLDGCAGQVKHLLIERPFTPTESDLAEAGHIEGARIWYEEKDITMIPDHEIDRTTPPDGAKIVEYLREPV